jgi:hypothetical protein
VSRVSRTEEDSAREGERERERGRVGEGESDECCMTAEKREIFPSQFHKVTVGGHCLFTNFVLVMSEESR